RGPLPGALEQEDVVAERSEVRTPEPEFFVARVEATVNDECIVRPAVSRKVNRRQTPAIERDLVAVVRHGAEGSAEKLDVAVVDGRALGVGVVHEELGGPKVR